MQLSEANYLLSLTMSIDIIKTQLHKTRIDRDKNLAVIWRQEYKEFSMSNLSEMWVKRADFRTTKIVTVERPSLQAGEVLVEIEKFGLTANNVSYAVSGDMIGYWKYYPAEGEWGKVPAWGFASVVESSCDDIPVGERLWGFFPMASHTVLRPGKVQDAQFTDISEHRQALPALYNQYSRTAAEPEVMQSMEDERCLLFPLFATSFIISDYLIDNDFFGAQQVLIGSASSKTGFGLAAMLHNNAEVSQRIVGFTSAANLDFVTELGCYDEVVVYGEELTVQQLPSAYIDMSGDVGLTKTIHHHLGEQLLESAMVGATHWENGGDAGSLPGAKPTFFFTPAHIEKREKEWGAGMVMVKAMMASFAVVESIKGAMSVEWINGAAGLDTIWQALLDNQVAGKRGLMVSLKEK